MQNSEIIFLNAGANDSAEITALVNSVYRGENSKKGWTTEAYILDGIRITKDVITGLINSKTDVIIKGVLNGDLIACVHLENCGSYSMLGMLSVDVNYQNKGIGKLLIKECERYTREEFGLREIRMKVIGARTELMEYYIRRNYIKTGETEDFDSTEGTFGIPKMKLHFEVLAKQI